jgi:hypothetical protein
MSGKAVRETLPHTQTQRMPDRRNARERPILGHTCSVPPGRERSRLRTSAALGT